MSTVKSVLGVLLLVLLPLLLVMMVGFATPANAQPRALYGITPTAEPPPPTPVPPTPVPPTPVNTPRPSNPNPTAVPPGETPVPPPAETPVPILPSTGAERTSGLLLPAVLVLASLTCLVATRRVRR